MTFWEWVSLNPLWVAVFIAFTGWAIQGIIRELRRKPTTTTPPEHKREDR